MHENASLKLAISALITFETKQIIIRQASSNNREIDNKKDVKDIDDKSSIKKLQKYIG
jgi:hypothetical protein